MYDIFTREGEHPVKILSLIKNVVIPVLATLKHQKFSPSYCVKVMCKTKLTLTVLLGKMNSRYVTVPEFILISVHRIMNDD